MYSPSGELISDGTWEYKPPLYNDIPEEFNIELLSDSPYKGGVRNSKAVGEPPLLLAITSLGATRAAIRASRVERGLDPGFTLSVPYAVAPARDLPFVCLEMFDFSAVFRRATIDRVQQAAEVSPEELTLDAAKLA